MKRILVILAAIISLCGCLDEKDYAERAIDFLKEYFVLTIDDSRVILDFYPFYTIFEKK